MYDFFTYKLTESVKDLAGDVKDLVLFELAAFHEFL